MQDIARTGVSLAALRELAERVSAGVEEGATVAAVVESIIRPATLSELCAYVELLPDKDRGVPSLVVIAPWTMSFSSLVDTLAQERPPDSSDPVYFWLDILACNLHNVDNDDSLDAISQASTVVSSVPSRSKPYAGGGTSLPTSALETYRRAIHAIAASSSSSASQDVTTAAREAPILAVVLDGDAAVLTSPWCLYGIWSYMRYRRAAVAAGKPAAITPLCAGPLDVLLTHLAWENLTLLLPSPQTPDAVHAAILEDVTAEAPTIPLPPGTATAAAPPKHAAAAAPPQADGGGGEEGQELDVEGRVAAADAAIKHGLLAAFEHQLQTLTTAIAAAQSAAAAGQNPVEPAAAVPPSPPSDSAGAASDAAADVAAAAEPSSQPPPSSAEPFDHQLQALAAATSDAYGCLLWAAGRPAEGEPYLRRARELHAGCPPPHPQPLMPLISLLHLGALLHVLPQSLDGDEAELLLRGAITRLDAPDDVARSGAAASAASTAVLAAHARHFLARQLCLRTSSHAAGSAAAASSRDASSLDHLRGAASAASREGATGSALPTAAAAPPPPLSGAAIMALPPAGAGGGSLAEVVPLLRTALPAFETHYGGGHLLTLAVRCNLALSLKDQGKLDEAEPLMRAALVACEGSLGPSHVDTLRCMNNLAGLLEEQGKLDEAEALLRRAAEAAASSLGPAHPYTANALSNLGVALRKADKLEEAEELFKTALGIRESLLGPLALDTAASLTDLTLLLMDQGRLGEAEPLLRRILDIREVVLGPEHPGTAASLIDLASLLGQMDRHAEAEPLLRRAVAVQLRCLGPGHEDTAAAVRELGKVLGQQGQMEEAEKMLRRALAVMESVLGPNHPETVTTVNQLAVLLMETDQRGEAEALFQRVLSVTDSLDLDTTAAAHTARRRLRAAAMVAMRGRAELAVAAGRLDEAEVLSCRALVLCERALGSVHPVTLACAEGLAGVLQQLGLLEDAGELYARLVETLAEEYGEDSEQVVKYLALYEAVYSQALERGQQHEKRKKGRGVGKGEGADDDDDDGGGGGDGDDGQDDDKEEEKEEEDSATESHATTTTTATTTQHVRTAPEKGVGALMTTLLGPLGRSITMKRRAAAARGQQSRSSAATAADAAAASAGGDGGDDDRGGGVQVWRHSFASFVKHRVPEQRQPQPKEQEQAVYGSPGSSRAQNAADRVHSSLVAAGRIGSDGPLGDARKSRLAAAAAAAAGSSTADGKPTADGADGGEGSVSPGLPCMDQQEDAACGAATVALDAPPRVYGSGVPLKAAAPKGSPGSQLPDGEEDVYDPTTMPLITASAFGYGSVTHGYGAAAGNRSIRPHGGTAGRRSSVDRIDVRRSATNSMIHPWGGISKKALLEQANIDLDDDEDVGDSGVYESQGGGGVPVRPPPPPPPPPPPLDSGRASRRVSGGSAAAAAAAATAADGDDDFEDTSAVGCCGFGGGGGAGRRVRPLR